METLKMTQALDEKGFLYKKICTQISNLDVVTVETKADTLKTSTKDFEDTAKADYQSIIDQIDRYNRLSSAIIKANAEAIIEVKSIKMTRAEAISLRSQLKSSTNLEQKLLKHLREQDRDTKFAYDQAQTRLNNLKERYTTNMITSNGAKDKTLSEDDIQAIDKLTEGFIPQIVDPIDIEVAIDKYGMKYDTLLQELETAIKLSNATTDVSF